MKLKLFLEQTGQSWTLKPNRDYVIGSSTECDIALPSASAVDSRHLKLSFDQLAGIWQVSDLGSSTGTFVNNQRVSSYPIQGQTRISLAGNIVLLAAPEGVTATAPPAPAIYNPATQQMASPIAPNQLTREPVRNSLAVNNSPFRVMNWGDYVETQALRQGNWWNRVAIRYHMMTGLRNTPWMDFDGYVLPDFNEPAEKIAAGIEANLNQLRRYENTDCYAVMLTDAHLTDSTRELFSNIELFALKRGGKRDFRRFCVVAHNRIRAYVVVDNYGSDLFVGILTRFESQPDGFVPAMILAIPLLIVLTISFLSSSLLGSLASGLYNVSPVSIGLWLMIIIGGLWAANFLGIPWLMREFKLLPKPANTQLIWLLFLAGLWLFFGLLTLLFPN